MLKRSSYLRLQPQWGGFGSSLPHRPMLMHLSPDWVLDAQSHSAQRIKGVFFFARLGEAS